MRLCLFHIRAQTNQRVDTLHMPIHAGNPHRRNTTKRPRFSLIAVCTCTSKRLDRLRMTLPCGPIQRTPSFFINGRHVGSSGNQQLHIFRAAAPRSQRYKPRLYIVVTFIRVNT